MSTLAQLRELGLTLSAVGDVLTVEPRSTITDKLRATIRAAKAGILRELADEVPVLPPPLPWGLSEVLAILAANPNVHRTFVNQYEGETVVLTLAVRGVGTCALVIPRSRFDADSLAEYDALAACVLNGGSAS
ncbi:MAG: hypothetical protein ABI885_24845 [Gammaproteobacteria bacterium]